MSGAALTWSTVFRSIGDALDAASSVKGRCVANRAERGRQDHPLASLAFEQTIHVEAFARQNKG
jgi:hypothetical protein